MINQTKEQLLQYFAGLDTSTLQRLQKYSQFLIIPDEDLLVNATMSQMISKAHSYADNLFPEWTDRSKSDFGEFLVELFAVFSEKDFWYINAFANEGILRKMRSYSNAFAKVSSMGYYPTTCKGSSGMFSVTFSSGQEVVYERGDLIVDVNGVKFTNDDSFSVNQSATEISIQLTLQEGNLIAEDVSYNGYSVFLRKDNIDLGSVQVTIDNIVYSQVRNFGLSSVDSTHFMVLPEEDGSCSVYFGNNGYGVQPAIGKSIRVEYRKCTGSSGNISLQEASINDSLLEREAVSVVMVSASSGGVNPETLTSIKEKAPVFSSTKKAAINERVSQDILNGFPFVHKSKVSLLGSDVTYRIIPSSGYLEPTLSDLDILASEFHPCLMAGYRGVPTINSYRNLLFAASPSATKIIVDAIISPGYSSDSIESSLRQVMDDVTNPLVKANYGGTFSKTSMDILMRSSISGVQSVTFKMLLGSQEQVMPDITLSPVEIFKPIVQTDLIVRINVI